MCGSCFCSHSRLSTTGYWPNLVTYSLRASWCWWCAFKAKAIRTMCVIAPEKIILPSATVKSQACCIGISFNLCSCANKKSINDAVAPQSTIAKVLNNKVSLLAIVHGRTMWLHCFFVLATSALADIDSLSPSSLQEQLCLETVCFLTCSTILLLFRRC